MGDVHAPQAIVKIMTSGNTQGAQIGGIDVTLDLPPGVSVKATPDAQNPNVLVTDSGVVVASGAAAGPNTLVTGTYTASPNRVYVHVANAGFGTGEFATVTCDLATGATVTAGDFNTESLYVVDNQNATEITGLTAGLTVEIR